MVDMLEGGKMTRDELIIAMLGFLISMNIVI